MTDYIPQPPIDITLEYYHKKAVYVSPYTGVSVHINIRRVYKRGNFTHIESTNGVHYSEWQLTDFSI